MLLCTVLPDTVTNNSNSVRRSFSKIINFFVIYEEFHIKAQVKPIKARSGPTKAKKSTRDKPTKKATKNEENVKNDHDSSRQCERKACVLVF